MSFSRLAIDNHQFTTVMIILLVMTGVISVLTMPRSEDPLVSPPGTNIVVVYPGASPEDLEELVVDPIEDALNELDDIKEILSTARDGLAVVTIEFETGVDMDDKYSEVVQKVNGIRDDLPEQIYDMEITRWRITDVCILQLGIVSETASYREMEREAELLKDQLEKLPGVKKIETMAFPEQIVRISVDLDRMAQYRMTLNEIEQAIYGANADIPGGYVDIGARRFTIQTSGSYESLEQIKNTVVRSTGQQVLYLKDVAEISSDYEDKTHYARVSGRNAVFVTAKQKERTNIFTVTDRLKQEIGEFESKLPSSMSLVYVFDQSQSVSRRVSGFFWNLMQGLLLVGLVVLLAASGRTAAIVILAIPISILIGLGLVDMSHYGLQQMSIAGLVIALGLLVDNAIVVTENITRYMRQGLSAREAAIKGTTQISWAVISSTVTTVLAFVPIILLPGITGDFIRSMPVTVVYTLLASLLVSLSLTPYLSSKFIRVSVVNNVGVARKRLNQFIEGPYLRILRSALKRPKTVILATFLVFIGSLSLFPVVGVSFFPKADKPQFIINVDMPEGTSLDRTDSVATFVESKLAERGNIHHWATNIGEGNPRIYYNVMPKENASNHAQILVELNEYDLEQFESTINGLRAEFDNYPGAEIRVKEFEQGPPIEAPIAIRVIGESLKTLEKVAHDVEQIIATTPGTINVENPLSTSKTDLHVNINRDKAAKLGVPLVEIDRTVRAAMAGLTTSTYRDSNGKEYDIVIRLPYDNGSQEVADFDRVHVSSIEGTPIPLKQLATIQFKAGPARINRYNLNRNVIITADITGSSSANEATMQIIDKLDSYDWPKGYQYYVAGELESREESFGGMGKAVIAALIAIFAVLVLQFRSYIQPLVVFAAIPVAVIGSILALLVTGYTFSFTAFVGITSLVGIVINNSIILVDYCNQLRRKGMKAVEAIQKAGLTRFAPIILTTLTTIGGLLPLTLGGGSMWAPMGWAIIGGLMISTMLTLVVVPVLYQLIVVRRDTE